MVEAVEAVTKGMWGCLFSSSRELCVLGKKRRGVCIDAGSLHPLFRFPFHLSSYSPPVFRLFFSLFYLLLSLHRLSPSFLSSRLYSASCLFKGIISEYLYYFSFCVSFINRLFLSFLSSHFPVFYVLPIVSLGCLEELCGRNQTVKGAREFYL